MPGGITNKMWVFVICVLGWVYCFYVWKWQFQSEAAISMISSNEVLIRNNVPLQLKRTGEESDIRVWAPCQKSQARIETKLRMNLTTSPSSHIGVNLEWYPNMTQEFREGFGWHSNVPFELCPATKLLDEVIPSESIVEHHRIASNSWYSWNCLLPPVSFTFVHPRRN